MEITERRIQGKGAIIHRKQKTLLEEDGAVTSILMFNEFEVGSGVKSTAGHLHTGKSVSL